MDVRLSTHINELKEIDLVMEPLKYYNLLFTDFKRKYPNLGKIVTNTMKVNISKSRFKAVL